MSFHRRNSLIYVKMRPPKTHTEYGFERYQNTDARRRPLPGGLFQL